MIFRFLLLAALLASCGAGAQTYRWVDEDGKTHFSDRAPMEQHSDEISNQLERSNIDQGASGAREELEKREVYESIRRREQHYEDQAQIERDQQRQLECREARRVLKIVQGRVAFLDEDGNEIRVSEKERSRKAVELQAQIVENCD